MMNFKIAKYLFIPRRRAVFKIAFFILAVSLMGNLNALVDAVLHPEIPYFDEEHLIVGGVAALFTATLLISLVIYINRLADFTERKTIDELTRKSEEEKRIILDAMSERLSYRDKDMRIVWANKAFIESTDFTPEEIKGRYCYEVLHKLSDPCPECPIHIKVLETGRSKEAEITTSDGKTWFVRGHPVRDSKGDIRGVVEISTDITDRKEAEEALRESQGKLNAMLQSIGDHMSMMDKDLNIIWANDTAKKIFGEDIVGKKCYEVYHGRKEPCEPYPCLTLKAFRDGKVHEHDTSVTDKDGNTVYFHCTANMALRDEKGKPTAVIEISRDITEHKLAEERLYSYQEQLRSSISQLSLIEEKERRRIAIELHDHIGQTLAYCKIKLGELRNLSSSTDIIGVLDGIRNLIEKTIQYTRSLTFDLSNPILYEVGFEAAVEWLGEKLQKEHGLMFHFNNDRQQKPLDDKTRVILLQVVRELLTNIIKHARARNLRVSIQRNNGYIQIDIKDDGVGFDASEIDIHMNKNYSVGIFSIRERLKSIKGQLNIESELGYGTSVTLTAPLNVVKKNVMEM
jgi:PAS domain S-box-containing protein